MNRLIFIDSFSLFQIISDIDLKAPSVKLVHLLSLHPSVTVYMYEFDYASKDDVIVTKYAGSKNMWVGKLHKQIFIYAKYFLERCCNKRNDKYLFQQKMFIP